MYSLRQSLVNYWQRPLSYHALNIGWALFFLVLTMIAATSLLSKSSFPSIYKAYVIRSGSMEPTIMTGDVILVNTRPKSLMTGDIITFADKENRTVTHRIVRSVMTDKGPAFTTKGDNNPAIDPATILQAQVVGSWWRTLPKLGFLVVGLGRPAGMVAILCWPVILVITGWLIDTKKT